MISAVQEARWREWFILPREVGTEYTRRDIGSGLENQSVRRRRRIMVPRLRELPGQPQIRQIAEQAEMLRARCSATLWGLAPAAALQAQLVRGSSTWVLASHDERGLSKRCFAPVQWGLSVLSHWGHPKKIRGRQCFS